ncbi:MAG: 16S rRNA (cytosine(1402)-N(4))-methyltransferase RsmH [Oscillospiraceae bacterium]|nr:16S rRNA (cytosine(1402)-N(4))-methyltransferase RsmH [Oscillospiraceae bacterium]
MEFNHVSVLLQESVDALHIRPDGVYVDATAGGGGHSAAIASRLTTGRLLALDRDPDAIAVLTERFWKNERVTVVRSVFNEIPSVLTAYGITRVDGILADLGVSSFQLDTAGRGFSFHQDAPLDMRMSKAGLSAADVVNTYSEKELSDIIFRYGEEKYARGIAKNIVGARGGKPIETTFELVEIIKRSMPQKAMRDSHPARKTFQALRIEVNGELSGLPQALDAMFEALSVGGVLAVISFHSLEDRIVKKKFADFCLGCTCPPEFPVCVCGKQPRASMPFKFIVPAEEELAQNPRSRSAKLRAVMKMDNN